jgi:hypothetical protein
MSESDETAIEAQDTDQDIEADDGDGGDGIPGLPSQFEAMLPDQVVQMMSLIRQENGIAKVLLQPAYMPDASGEPQVSQAEALADMVNILRLDTKALGEAAGADIEARRVTPERAATMMQDLVKQENMDLITAFNDIEEQHEQVLLELTDEETVEAHRETKRGISHFAQAAEEVDGGAE